MSNVDPISKLLHHVTIFRNLQLRLQKKSYFYIFCHIIIMICDMLEKFLLQSKLSMLLRPSQKKFFVSVMVKKRFMVKYGSLSLNKYNLKKLFGESMIFTVFLNRFIFNYEYLINYNQQKFLLRAKSHNNIFNFDCNKFLHIS